MSRRRWSISVLTGIITIALVSIALAVPISRIYLGNVDGEPPVSPSAPLTVTLLSTDAAYEIGITASFSGARNPSINNAGTDTDGAGSWTTFAWSVESGASTQGFAVPVIGGTRIVTMAGATVEPAGGCDAFYTDNSGGSWTRVNFTVDEMTNCFPSSGGTAGVRTIACDGISTCYLTGVTTTATGTCNLGSCITVFKSTNSGTTWGVTYVQSYPGTDGWNLAGSMHYVNGDIWVAAGQPGALCAPGVRPTRIFSDVGGNGFSTGACIVFYGGTRFNGVYYLWGSVETAGTPATLWSSTDRITWTNLGAPTFSPTMTNAGVGVMVGLRCFENYSNPTCYLILGNGADAVFRVYTSENMSNFTSIFSVASGGPGTSSGSISQDTRESTLPLYFGTIGGGGTNGHFYSIT